MPFALKGMPISKLKGNWTCLLNEDRLQRSSQVLSVIDQTVCVFGGEVKPREPVDDQVDVFSLNNDTPNLETKSHSSAPSPRVGSTSAVINGNMYIFSGRGGTEMAPIEEHGAVWSYNPSSSSWSNISPADSSKPHPPARSYHCSASDNQNNIFIHAGCPTSDRLSDLWKFDISDRTWTQLPDAPAPHRGGASIAYKSGKLYRMHGFDGTTEQGGSIDIFDISSNTWSTETFNPDGNDGPEARSVSVLLPVRLAQKDKLITLFGERDPSSQGHAGAGKMLSDVWIYDISENWWTQLHPEGTDGVPDPRGWFDADVVKNEDGNDSVVLHGGLGGDNERLKDVWRITF
ncbi:galactose oxidase [Dothidotthia symphoricarpi CBS 119687]|uniref:Galactose oxidase n=1 Tax=Dothidotthia symphoricarpi CBS 119687 TaxID=1392245 RepID=A0A6A6AA13_9PLEO|nr:galactose oxidase [Dothidotthia symphoricarpi CBS 119687]KAF2128043.1 galactose oxidase [Dothidotthia symphoricarpi CBS 119687]